MSAKPPTSQPSHPKNSHEAPSRKLPTYALHKATGQAVVRLSGQDHYLGVHGSRASLAEYQRLTGLWLLGGRRPLDHDVDEDITVAELLAGYWAHAQTYYRKNGRPGGELRAIRAALRPLAALYADQPAAGFGPRALKIVRAKLIASGMSRKTINGYVNRIHRAFRWAVGEELIDPQIHLKLRAVEGLRSGRSAAKESRAVKPVADGDVEAVRPLLAPPVGAMIDLQLLTAMRPGEVVVMRPCDLDTGGQIWQYTLATHKTEHFDERAAFDPKVVDLGPRAQQVIRDFLAPDVTAYLFAPAAGPGVRGGVHYRHKVPGGRTGRRLGARYTVDSYRRAIARACREAGVPHWHPHQLRHTAATRIRAVYGIEAARAMLGHRSIMTTQIYAEMDRTLVRKIVGEVG